MHPPRAFRYSLRQLKCLLTEAFPTSADRQTLTEPSQNPHSQHGSWAGCQMTNHVFTLDYCQHAPVVVVVTSAIPQKP